MNDKILGTQVEEMGFKRMIFNKWPSKYSKSLS